jgi:hypothetical protein
VQPRVGGRSADRVLEEGDSTTSRAALPAVIWQYRLRWSLTFAQMVWRPAKDLIKILLGFADQIFPSVKRLEGDIHDSHRSEQAMCRKG